MVSPFRFETQTNTPPEWLVVLFGAEGTCFQGGSFLALLRFPNDYPNSPPSVQFQSHIFHPNVYRDGKVCISTLQLPSSDASAEDSKLCWSCVLGAHGALESVVSLIGDPNPDDPANAEAANVFRTNFDHFAELARQASEDSKHDLPHGFARPVIVHRTALVVPPTRPIQHHNSDGDDDEYYYSE